MVQLDKRYFPLKEIAKRWGLRKRDLVYMAEVGELRTSVRIPGAHIEVGMLEASQDQRVRVRYERILVHRAAGPDHRGCFPRLPQWRSRRP